MKRRDALKALCTLPLIGQADVLRAQPSSTEKEKQSKAKNLIIVSADGMGMCQWQAPGIRRKQPLSVMGMPYCCMVDTLPLDKINGDAPSHITAMVTGHATRSGWVGLDADGQPVKNLMEIAHERGIARGIVSANSLAEGSIVPFVAHAKNRMMVEPITAAYAFLTVR